MTTNGIDPDPVKSKKETKPTSTSDDKNVRVFFFVIIKKVILINVIYLVGYMNLSVAWLITPMVLVESRNFWGKSTDVKREIAQASTKGREKDVILTRVKDLPSWVFFPDFERCEWVNCVSFVLKTELKFIFDFSFYVFSLKSCVSMFSDFGTNLANVTWIHNKLDKKCAGAEDSQSFDEI